MLQLSRVSFATQRYRTLLKIAFGKHSDTTTVTIVWSPLIREHLEDLASLARMFLMWECSSSHKGCHFQEIVLERFFWTVFLSLALSEGTSNLEYRSGAHRAKWSTNEIVIYYKPERVRKSLRTHWDRRSILLFRRRMQLIGWPFR